MERTWEVEGGRRPPQVQDADDVRDRSFPREVQSTHMSADSLAEAEVRYAAEYAEPHAEESLS